MRSNLCTQLKRLDSLLGGGSIFIGSPFEGLLNQIREHLLQRGWHLKSQSYKELEMVFGTPHTYLLFVVSDLSYNPAREHVTEMMLFKFSQTADTKQNYYVDRLDGQCLHFINESGLYSPEKLTWTCRREYHPTPKNPMCSGIGQYAFAKWME